MSSVFPLDGFGVKRWVVGCYVDLDHDIPEEKEQEVTESIVATLNTPPERKKFERNRTTSLYGNLEIFSAKFKKDSAGKTYVEMLLITDDRANEHFWGEGIKMIHGNTRRRKNA